MSQGTPTTDARERARRLAAEQAKKSSKKSTRWIQFTVLGVVALIVAIVAFVVINGGRNQIPEAGPVPASANQYGGIVLTQDGIVKDSSEVAERNSSELGTSEATYTAADGTETKMPLGVALPEEADNNGEPVRVTIFQDFNCVHCAAFETENAETIASLVSEGKITLELRNLTFLDANSPTFYSARANNVAYSVANQVSAEDYLKFQQEVFTYQAQNGTSNEELIKIAEKYGADVKEDVTNNTWRPFIQTVTSESATNGIAGTPTIFADGEVFTEGPTGFAAWIEQKIADKDA
ncbi:DsbA family protein [Rothia nasimurium]|uniref:DsbA family protein n=1 Tax=Rothia nasimurium TaxID=85336 RepID=UPI003BA07E1C